MTLYRCTVPGCGITATKRLRRPPQCPRDCCNLVPVGSESEQKVLPEDAADKDQIECHVGPDGDLAEARLGITIDQWRDEIFERRILGRNGDIATDRFREDLSTAREHAELYREGGRWWVRNLCKSGSPCVLNGREMGPGQSAAIDTPGLLILGTRGLTVYLDPPKSTGGARGALEEYFHGENSAN